MKKTAQAPARTASEEERLALLASIVDGADDAVVSTTLDGIVTSWNPAAERMYAYKAAEIIGEPYAILLPPDPSDQLAFTLEEIRHGRRVGPYDTLLARKDGSTIPVSVTLTPVRDARGTVTGGSSIARDISGRKRAEEEARTTSQYARSLIEASPDLLMTISPEGKITDVNAGSIKVTGVPRAQLLGTDFFDYFTEPDRAREGYQQVFSRGSVTDYPLTIRHKDGRLTEVLYNGSVYRDAGGKALGVFAAARDVTAQKRAEAVIAEQQSRELERVTELERFQKQYARSLIEASPDPLVTISPEGRITDVNEGTIEATGVPRDELIGSDFCDYFTDRGRAHEGYQQVFKRGIVTDFPLTIRHRDGRPTEVLYSASLYKDARGGVLGVFAAARDVTAQKRAEAVIAEQQSRELERVTELERFQKQYARSLIEASPDPLVTISPEGRITDVNEGTIRATGVPRENLIGTDFCDYFTEPARAREGYQQIFDRGIVTDFPLTIRNLDGRRTEVLYSASLYKDARGGVLGVFAAARDVTAQKRAEAVIADQQSRELERVNELERFQKQYARSLIEASPDPLVTISPEGRITDVNEGTIKATGVPREKLIGTDFCDYFTEPARAREGYQQIFDKGIVTDFPLTIRNLDGRRTEVLYSASLYKDARGGVLGVFAAARDVTAQKRAEAVIAEVQSKELERVNELERFQKQYARSLIEASPDPLVTISPEGRITDVNEGTIEATGVPREKLIGTDFCDYFTEPARAREGYQQIFDRGIVTDFPLTIRNRNGQRTEVLYSASLYKDARGGVLGVFAAARDVTAQMRAEAVIADQRGKELERIAELERFQKLTVGRELKMIELKKEIEELKKGPAKG